MKATQPDLLTICHVSSVTSLFKTCKISDYEKQIIVKGVNYMTATHQMNARRSVRYLAGEMQAEVATFSNFRSYHHDHEFFAGRATDKGLFKPELFKYLTIQWIGFPGKNGLLLDQI